MDEEQKQDLVFPDDYFHYDTQNLIEQYAKLGTDVHAAYELGNTVTLPELKHRIDHIAFIGMGGSAISGDFIDIYLEKLGVNVPITIVRDYHIPPSITENTLVIAISYSGNTEETLSAFKEAMRKTKYCIALACGGRLEEITKVNRTPFLIVPKGYQPRTAALSYLFFPVIKILERLQIIPDQSKEVEDLTNNIAKPDFKTYAMHISEKLMGKIPLVYASEQYKTIAFRLKTQINENAKQHAFWGSYSEFNHNELVGYGNLLANHHIITYRFNDDHRRVHKRMDLVKEVTNKAGIETTEIKITGDHLLTKLFSAVLIGDLTSYYLALRNKIDPSPVVVIEELKNKMGPTL